MRKWTYLVAALLMSGTAATFTSCIDNEEPAGIEAMRNAKAEFYSAQARYKAAEAAYKEASALIEAEKAKQEEIATRMKELQYQLAEAENQRDIETIQMRLDEAKADHEVSMKNYETALKEAEAAYQTALRDLDLIVAKLNSDYTKEYGRILSSITANRTKYNKLAADLINANLLLNKFAERTLDTASVRGTLERDIITKQQTLADLEEQKELLVKLNGADSETQIELAKELNTTIRTKVEEYNVKVEELNKKVADKAVADQAVTDKRNSLTSQYQPKFEETKSESYTIDPAIQNKFIVENNLTNAKNVKKTEMTSFKNDQQIVNYYTFTDSKHDIEVKAGDLSGQPSANNTTAKKIKGIINGYMVNASNEFNSIDTPITEEEAKAKLPGLKAWLSEIETTYNSEIENNYTPAKTAYLDARSKYMIDAETSWYEKVDKAIDVYQQITTPTDADKDNLIEILKEYAPIRKAYDGYVHKTGTGDDAKETWTTLDKATFNVTIANNIKGTVKVLSTPEKTSALGKIKEISEKIFGTTTTPVLSLPESVAAEYNYKRNFPSSGTAPTYAGIFGQYYNAYEDVKEIEEAIAWKALHETFRVDVAEYLMEETEYASINATVSKDPEVIALKEAAIAIGDEIAILEDLVGSSANANVVTVQVISDDSDISTIKLKDLAVNAGTMGSYLTSLENYYNKITTNNNNFNAELIAIEAEITAAQSNLFNAQADLEEFDEGGYELTQNNPGSIIIGEDEMGYTEISKTNTTDPDGKILYYVYFYNPDGTIKDSLPIYSSDPDFETNFNNILYQGNNITVKSDYLKVIIEAYEAKVENINAQMADLDAQHLILQKELSAFMEVLNERYPEATAE